MSGYKYQLHCHTAPCSDCGESTPREFAEALAVSGYAGACITNHFYHGNSGIDRDKSWDYFVSAYEKDWLECKSFGERYGIDILFGIEEGVGDGLEILCYGLTPEMLYAHPELEEKSAELWYKTLSPLGVLIIQAHPFRQRGYITAPGVLPLEYIDGIEVYNAGHQPEYDAEALEYSRRVNGLILTSGADSHTPETLSNAGICSECRIDSSEKLAEVLKSGKYSLIEPKRK